VRNATSRKDVALMSTATLLDYATLTKTVYLHKENMKIFISAQERLAKVTVAGRVLADIL